MATIDTQPVKGTRDFYPEELRVRSWLFAHWREVARRYGYEEFDACVLEHEELYVRKAGDEITAQLYNFTDKGDRRVALRPELTPSLARMVLAKGSALALPLRWFAIPQCFRYEQSQKGRKREHFQWNMDIIGLASVAGEAELMAAQVDFLGRVGMDIGPAAPEIIFRVSNRQIIEHVLSGMGIVGESFPAVCVAIDKRDKIGAAATLAELVRIGVSPAQGEEILALIATSGLDQVAARVGADNPGVRALSELMSLAEAAGFAHLLRIDLSVIRGLSYYTGTVWEVFDASGAMPRAIAGGGRYDRLMQTLGGTPVAMVGFGFGDVVITEILRERGRLPQQARGIDDVVYPLQAEQFAVATRLAAALRRQGRAVAVDYTCRRFKNVIERAEKDGVSRLLILGGDEVRAGVCTVRHLGQVTAAGEAPTRKEEKLALATIMGG